MVWGGGALSAAFDVNIGVKQGCPASPHLFCLLSNKVRDFIVAHTLSSHQVHNPFLSLAVTFILLYVDDFALIAASLESLQQLLHAFGCFVDVHGMRIS